MNQRSPFRARSLAFLMGLFVIVGLVSCGTPKPPTVDPPVIVGFEAEPATLPAGGGDVTLSWEVTGTGLTVTVAEVGGDVIVANAPAAGETDVVGVTASTTFRLTATNAGGTVTQDVDVDVQSSVAPPSITSFTADPASVPPAGASVTLAWVVAGDGVSVVVARTGGETLLSDGPATGDLVVPDVTPGSSFTLTATNASGTVDAEVTVTEEGVDPAPVVTSFSAEVVVGSRLALSWTATDATGFEVYAVLDGNTDDRVALVVSSPSATGGFVPIPASNRQILALIATGPGGSSAPAFLAERPANVVVNGLDYDPYDTDWWVPGPEAAVIPGSLRAVIDQALAGAVVGFASDVTEVALFGVEILDPKTDSGYADLGLPPTAVTVDSHLVFPRDVTVSGPAGAPVTIGWAAHPSVVSDPFTWRSRMLFVPRGRTVSLSNLVIEGGDFIFTGAGVRNDGVLAMTDVEVRDNRAWQFGGGVANVGGTMALERVVVRGNQAVTFDPEVGQIFRIRENTIEPIESAPSADLSTTDDGYGGGVINVTGPGGTVGTLTIVDSVIEDNEAKISGGGVFVATGAGAVSISGTDIVDNLANSGAYAPRTDGLLSFGGGVASGGPLQMSNGDVRSNFATAIGGGVANFVTGTMTLDGVLITLNEAEFYGCYHNAAPTAALTLTGGTACLANVPNTFLGGVDAIPGMPPVPASLAPNPVGPALR